MTKAQQLMELYNELRKKAQDIQAEACDAHYKASEILAQKHSIEEVEIGSWKCKNSEIGICYYDPNEDPCLDSCLVCYNPNERK